jgi:hypothetical protein
LARLAHGGHVGLREPNQLTATGARRNLAGHTGALL